MHFHRQFLQITTAVLLLGAISAHAETLAQMTAEALRRNPELQAFTQSVAAAKGGVKTARTFQNPELTVAPGLRRLDEGDRKSDLFHAEFELSQLFRFPGKQALEIAIAQRNVELAGIALEGFRFQLAAKVRHAFYDALAADKLIQTRHEQIESAKTFLESARKRAEAGYASDFETVKSQADLIGATKALRQAEVQRTTARVSLNLLMGHPPNAPLTVAGQMADVQSRGSRTDFTALAMARNPAIRTQTRQVELAGLNLRSTHLGRRPDIAIGPSVEYPDNEQTYGLSATLSLPLWDQKQGEIETATAEQRRALAEIEKTRAEIAAEVTKASATFQTAKEQAGALHPGISRPAEEASSPRRNRATRRTRPRFSSISTPSEPISTRSPTTTSRSATSPTSRAELESAVGVPLEPNTLNYLSMNTSLKHDRS